MKTLVRLRPQLSSSCCAWPLSVAFRMLAQPFVYLFGRRLAPQFFAETLAHVLAFVARGFFKLRANISRRRLSFCGLRVHQVSDLPDLAENLFIQTVHIYHRASILKCHRGR